MHVPGSFAISDEKIFELFIEKYDFATLTSSSSSGLVASHIPIMLQRSAGKAVLVGHVARANSHWRQFDGSADTLAIFHGPHAYVSPSWYATGPAVPTWNYSAVHVYGKALAREDGDFTAAVLRDLVARHEGARGEAMAHRRSRGGRLRKAGQEPSSPSKCRSIGSKETSSSGRTALKTIALGCSRDSTRRDLPMLTRLPQFISKTLVDGGV